VEIHLKSGSLYCGISSYREEFVWEKGEEGKNMVEKAKSVKVGSTTEREFCEEGKCILKKGTRAGYTKKGEVLTFGRVLSVRVRLAPRGKEEVRRGASGLSPLGVNEMGKSLEEIGQRTVAAPTSRARSNPLYTQIKRIKENINEKIQIERNLSKKSAQND